MAHPTSSMSRAGMGIGRNRSGAPWSEYRDSSLSWLAIGVLLAAWNACDDDPPPAIGPRPGVLREYPVVSRRALESSRALQGSLVRPPHPLLG